MYDVEKICELQRKLDEYERFHGELFLMLYNRDVKRQFVLFREEEVLFGEDIIKQVKKLIEEVQKC
jgi:predicted site-specific integrase-resolvase